MDYNKRLARSVVRFFFSLAKKPSGNAASVAVSS
jgi:hypothetical protein